MEEMHAFDDLEMQIRESEETVSATFDIVGTTETFPEIKERLCKTVFKEEAKYLTNASNIEEIIIHKKAFDLGEEFADAINRTKLDTFAKKVALYGFINELNCITQLEACEDPENIILLIQASKKSGFVLMDYFDQTGSYINYPKLKKFLSNRG